MTRSREAPIARPSGLRVAARFAALAGCVFATTVCGEQGRFGGVTNPSGDTESPVVAILFPGGVNDSVVDITDSLKFTARSTDNIRVASFRVKITGIAPFVLDSTFDSTITTVLTIGSKDFVLPLASNAAGQRIAIAVTALDAAGNQGFDSVTAVIDDPQPPALQLREPSSGFVVPAGDTLQVVVRGVDASGLDTMGARLFQTRNLLGQPVTISQARRTYAAGTTVRTDTFLVVVPVTLDPGSYFVHAFGTDLSPNRNDTTTADVSITVADTAQPVGAFTPPLGGANRTAGDSIQIIFRARDSAGVASLTLRGNAERGVVALGTDTTVVRYVPKTTAFASRPSDTTITRYLNAVLTDSTVEKVYVEAVITDVGGNVVVVRDSVQVTGGPFVRVTGPSADTTLQNGTTGTITVLGFDPRGLTFLGYQATGAITRNDSLAVAPSAANAVLDVLLPVPAGVTGSVQIVPFARTGTGPRFTGNAINLFVGDTVRPTIVVLGPALDSNVSAGDSILVRVQVLDNRGVSSLSLAGTAERGDSLLGTNQSVTRYSPKSVTLPALPVDTTITRYLLPVLTDSTVEPVYLSITAVDDAGNTLRALRRIQIDAGPFVSIARPATGDTVPVNSQYDVIVTSYDPDSLLYLGVSVSGRVTTADSVEIIRPETRRSQAVPVSFPLLVREALGTVTITPFARDRLGNRFTGRAVVVTLKDLLPPYVEIQQPDSTGIDTIGSGAPAIVRVRVQDDRSVVRVDMASRDSVGQLAFFQQTSLSLPTSWPYGLDPNPALDTAIVVSGTVVDTLSALTANSAGRAWIIVRAVDSTGNAGWDSVRVYVAAPPAPVIDSIAPVVTISQPAVAGLPVTVGDSVLVRFQATDGRGVDSVVVSGVARRGVDSLGTAADVQRFATKGFRLPLSADTTLSRYLLALAADSSSEIVQIIVTAFDGSGNAGADTATVRIVRGPTVEVVRPVDGTTTSPGKSVILEVRAEDSDGVAILGYRIAGVMAAQDSIIRTATAGTLPDTASFLDTVTVPAATPLGTLTIVPFAKDSLGDPSGTITGVTVTVQSAAADVTPPTVRFTVGRRVETDDTISVNAVDPGGIRRVGWTATVMGSAVVIAGDSTAVLPGTLSDVTQAFSLALPGSPTLRFPAQVVITAFGLDSLSNRATSAAETLTVVAGKTYALPAGSQIGDGIYNSRLRELYLSNTSFDRIEVFSLASNSFVASIPVGSRPVGLAMFPRDSTGNYKDTLIVANNGGTNLSIVDLVSRREIRRHRLPNYQVQTVKTTTNGGGGLDVIITEWDFSDRPFHIGATCRTSGTAQCTRVRVLYSTTPTAAQATPFTNRGYLAWTEMDTVGTIGLPSHLVYEHSIGGVDTLQLIAVKDTIPGQAIRDTILGAGVGTRVTISDLAFAESTFVRNSGDFYHGLVGEGGAVAFARALTFDVRPGLVYDTSTAAGCSVAGFVLKCGGFRDAGVSASIHVRDFVANRAARITSIATNFNGRTNLVRADSIYAFDFILRQTGMMQIGAGNSAVGMDFHPSNNFDATLRGTGGAGYQDSRLVFAARPDSSLDVFDTYFYGRVTDTTSTSSTIPIPIRNALLGPVRVASDAGNTVLFGLTAYGLVVVNVPSLSNSLFPVIGQPVVTQPRIRVLPDERTGRRGTR